MIEWLRFGLVVLIIAVDDVLREIALSTVAATEFFLDHVRAKVHVIWRSRR